MERTYELLEGLVLWAKSRNVGQVEHDIVRFLPTHILHKIKNLWSDLLLKKAISLEIEDRGVEISWDPLLFEIVLRNLVHNAIKNSPPHSTIRVHIERFNGKWIAEVEDQGPGFPNDILQGEENLRDNELTTGLGLRLIRELLEPTGATLKLENKNEGGAVARLVYEPHHSLAS